MSIERKAVLRTRQGLIEAHLIFGTWTAWDGADWIDFTLEHGRVSEMGDAVLVGLSDGTLFTAEPTQQVLVATRDQYMWKPVARLKTTDRVCRPLCDDPTELYKTHRHTPEYWFGWMATSGKHFTNKIRIAVAKWSQEEKAICDHFRSFAAKHNLWCDIEGSHPTYIWLGGESLRKLVSAYKIPVDRENDTHVGIPSRALSSTTRARKAFCTGLLESSKVRDGDTMKLDLCLHDSLSALDAAFLLRSVGVRSLHHHHQRELNVSAENSEQLVIDRWEASLELPIKTPYPANYHLRGNWENSVTGQCLDELTAAIDRHNPRGTVCGVIRDIIRDGKALRPAAARAAWRALDMEPHTPVYDTAAVDEVTFAEASFFYEAKCNGPPHSFVANEVIFNDGVL